MYRNNNSDNFMNNNRQNMFQNQMNCGCNVNKCTVMKREKTIIDASCVDDLPLAMAYVPMQRINTLFDCQTALYQGTIFPELVLPLEGCRGGRL